MFKHSGADPSHNLITGRAGSEMRVGRRKHRVCLVHARRVRGICVALVRRVHSEHARTDWQTRYCANTPRAAGTTKRYRLHQDTPEGMR